MMKALTNSRRANCYLGFGVTATNLHPAVALSQLCIFADRYLARFNQQKAQQPGPLFTDRADPATLTGTIFDRIESHIGGHLARIGKAFR
jgi:hypothetical protein